MVHLCGGIAGVTMDWIRSFNGKKGKRSSRPLTTARLYNDVVALVAGLHSSAVGDLKLQAATLYKCNGQVLFCKIYGCTIWMSYCIYVDVK